MKIWLYQGYHSKQVFTYLEKALSGEGLLICCPPYLADWDFLDFLPEGEFIGLGGLANRNFPLSSSRKSLFLEQPVLGVFTSATSSGKPRLVLYSKQNIDHCLSGVLSFFDTERIRKIFSYPQPSHAFGLVLGYALSHSKMIPSVSLEGPYTTAFHEKRLEQTEPGLLTLGTPTHFRDLLAYCQRTKVQPRPSYSCIAGGATVSMALWKSMHEELQIETPSVGYGATELSPAVTHLGAGIPPLVDGDIGRILPGLKLSLHGLEGVYIEGPSVCLATVDEKGIQFPKKIHLKDHLNPLVSGHFQFKGRLDFMLNRGGDKIALESLEEIVRLQLHLEVLCVRVPHERLGEDLGIISKSALSQEKQMEIRKTLSDLSGRNFSNAPFYVVDDFPLNAHQKVDRHICENWIRKTHHHAGLVAPF